MPRPLNPAILSNMCSTSAMYLGIRSEFTSSTVPMKTTSQTARTSSAPSYGPEVLPTTSIAMAEPGVRRNLARKWRQDLFSMGWNEPNHRRTRWFKEKHLHRYQPIHRRHWKIRGYSWLLEGPRRV